MANPIVKGSIPKSANVKFALFVSDQIDQSGTPSKGAYDAVSGAYYPCFSPSSFSGISPPGAGGSFKSGLANAGGAVAGIALAGSNDLTNTVYESIGAGNSWTLLALYRPVAISTFTTVFQNFSGYSPQRGYSMGVSSAGNLQHQATLSTASNAGASSTSGIAVAGQLMAAAFVNTAGFFRTVKNGSTLNTSTFTAGPVDFGASGLSRRPGLFNVAQSKGNTAPAMEIYAVIGWDASLTDAEIAQFGVSEAELLAGKFHAAAFDFGDGPPPDTTKPTMSGAITIGTVTSSSIQASWPAASDNVAVTSYETSLDGTSWTDRGDVLTYTFSGLTASTSYTVRVRAKDAVGNVADTPLQATQSTGVGGDTTKPVMQGAITVGTVGSSSIAISWPAATDAGGGTLTYETSADGASWADRGTGLSFTFTGLTASTSYTLRVRAKDASGNVADTPLQVTQSTAAAGGSGASVDLSQAGTHTLKNKLGAIYANTPVKLSFQRADTDAFVVVKTLTTSAAGLCGLVTDAALVAGVVYDIKFTIVATGAKGLFPGALAV